jgi:hypothetical protein
MVRVPRALTLASASTTSGLSPDFSSSSLSSRETPSRLRYPLSSRLCTTSIAKRVSASLKFERRICSSSASLSDVLRVSVASREGISSEESRCCVGSGVWFA